MFAPKILKKPNEAVQGIRRHRGGDDERDRCAGHDAQNEKGKKPEEKRVDAHGGL